MQTTITLQVTEVQFDFDDLDFTPEQQEEVVDYALDNTFDVEVDDVGDERQIADALVECVTDLTGWCVVSLNYREVLS
jgi:ribosome maturation factor RimP